VGFTHRSSSRRAHASTQTSIHPWFLQRTKIMENIPPHLLRDLKKLVAVTRRQMYWLQQIGVVATYAVEINPISGSHVSIFIHSSPRVCQHAGQNREIARRHDSHLKALQLYAQRRCDELKRQAKRK
jgi:hypothetical protein